jgi:hypothetical protein
MAPFRWPDTKHDIALAKEVAAVKPVSSEDWEIIARTLGTLLSTNDKPVELKGRGCRERLQRLIEKFKKEDARSLKRYLIFILYVLFPLTDVVYFPLNC